MFLKRQLFFAACSGLYLFPIFAADPCGRYNEAASPTRFKEYHITKYTK